MGRKSPRKPRKGKARAGHHTQRAPHIPEMRPDKDPGREPLGRGLPRYGGSVVPGLVCGREPHVRVHPPTTGRGCKEKYDAAPLPRAARDAAGRIPRLFITDGLERHHTAFKKAFRTLNGPISIHIRDIHIRNLICNTNKQERFCEGFAGRHMARPRHKQGVADIQHGDTPPPFHQAARGKGTPDTHRGRRHTHVWLRQIADIISERRGRHMTLPKHPTPCPPCHAIP